MPMTSNSKPMPHTTFFSKGRNFFGRNIRDPLRKLNAKGEREPDTNRDRLPIFARRSELPSLNRKRRLLRKGECSRRYHPNPAG